MVATPKAPNKSRLGEPREATRREPTHKEGTSMAKKLSLLLAAVAVLAFAVPAFASAATGLTESGKLVPVGTNIVGTNVGNVITTSTKTGNITCGTVTVTAKVTANSSAKVTAAGNEATTTASSCTVAGGGVANVSKINLSSLETTGGGTGTAVLSFQVELPGGVICKYSTPGGTGTYNPSETAEGGNVITLSEVPLSVTPAACGTTAKLDGKFKMETDGTSTSVFLL
jgi:hypothetical protein